MIIQEVIEWELLSADGAQGRSGGDVDESTWTIFDN